MATITEKKVRRPQVRQTQCFIGGKWVPAASGKTFETIHPATEEVICEVAEGDKEDVDAAVDAARDAFDNGEWSKMDARDRGILMNKLADLIEEEADELAALETLDNGKPISDSRAADIPLVIDCLRYYAGWADKIQGATIPVRGDYFTLHAARAGRRRRVRSFPWNFPALMVAWKWGPALAAGCTIVMKPAEQTPLTCLRMARLAQKAGIPDGVINVVPGFGPTAGAAVVKHPGIDKVAFTGELATAKIIQRNAAETMKRLTFELGGKSPNVIFADSDLDAAIEGAHFGLYFNQGQCCCAGSRLFVEEKVHDEVIDRMQEKNRDRKVGDPFDPETQQGPQVDEAQFDKILHYVEYGKKDGAKMLTGGKRVGDQGLLRRADAVRQRDGRHADRPRGDLRPGDERAEVQERGRNHPPRERHELRPGRRRLDPRRRQGPPLCRRACGPARCGSTATTSSTPPPRSAASSKAASAANWAKPVWPITLN